MDILRVLREYLAPRRRKPMLTNPGDLVSKAERDRKPGDLAAALSALRKAAKSEEVLPGWYIRLARLLVQGQKFDEAIPLFEEGLRRDSSHAVWHVQYARALQSVGAVDTALSAFEDALRIDDTKGEWWFQYGKLLVQAGLCDKAVEPIKKSVELKPECGAFHAFLGQILTRLARIPEAAEAFRLAVESEGGNAVWKAELKALEKNRVTAPSPAGRGGERESAWYDTVYKESSSYREHYECSAYSEAWNRIIVLLQSVKPKFILEVGCGAGQLAKAIHDSPLGAGYLGFDFSKEAINLAKSHCPSLGFKVADALTTELMETVPYDVVVCTEVLEHIQQDKEVIERVKTGSWFIGTVPDFDSISHVRFFKGVDAVSKRYRPWFSDFTVEGVRLPGNGTLFIFVGRKI